ncbi:HAD family hydrolase [Candidatus Peribacteria bacterium]|nr:HAD family hydrolase [Candidatus Peribacteria bacterium]
MVTTLLLDRDGVLIRRLGHAYTLADIVPLPGVVEGLKQLGHMKIFVVSNQSGVGRGKTTIEEVQSCNNRLMEVLQSQGITITDIVFCPHHPDENCDCRKPKIGMWKELERRHGLTSDECVMVGDHDVDVLFGQAVGCKTILVGDEETSVEPTWKIASLSELPALLASAV